LQVPLCRFTAPRFAGGRRAELSRPPGDRARDGSTAPAVDRPLFRTTGSLAAVCRSALSPARRRRPRPGAPAARRDAERVEDRLRLLAAFYTSDLAKLRGALRAAGRSGGFVPQEERDALFLAQRA